MEDSPFSYVHQHALIYPLSVGLLVSIEFNV